MQQIGISVTLTRELESVMGDFKGHVLPGVFLITLGIWWTTKCVLKYAFKNQKQTSYFDPKALFCRMEMLEGIVLVGMALIGMLSGQFIPGGPHLILYNYKENQWVRLLDWHHFTIYLFFGLLGVTNILCSTIRSLPPSFSKLMLLNALFVEAFVFYNHTHGREVLDIFVHNLLFLAICLTALITFMELFIQAKITVELLRTSLFLLQGSWFWQMAFVLYPINGNPPWDLMDHNNIMFLTICFCWHYAIAIIITGAIYAFVTRSDGKESACNVVDLGLIPGSGKSPGEGNGTPLQYSYLENPMITGTWQATVHGESHDHRNLAGYSPWAHEESDMTK